MKRVSSTHWLPMFIGFLPLILGVTVAVFLMPPGHIYAPAVLLIGLSGTFGLLIEQLDDLGVFPYWLSFIIMLVCTFLGLTIMCQTPPGL